MTNQHRPSATPLPGNPWRWALARAEGGSVLLAIIVAITVAASLGTAIYSLVSTGSLTQIGSMNDTKAYYLAESGGHYGIKRLTDPSVNLSTDFATLSATLTANPFFVANAGQFSLQNFSSTPVGGFLEVRFDSTGIPTDASISRKINYIVKVPDPAGVEIPFDGTGPDLNPENWNVGGPGVLDTTDPNNPKVTLGGANDAQISLDWNNPGSTLPNLEEVRDEAGGLLTYEAQVKVKLSTAQDVLSGISFRLNTGGNTNVNDDTFYGLSYLWCESNASGRDLPAFCGAETSRTYIVLWKQAADGSKTIIGKKLASAVTSGLVSSNALNDWSTLVVRLQEQYNLVTNLRENMIYAYVGIPSTSPRGTIHWDYSKYPAVQWELPSFTGNDCSGGQRFFISDSTYTTANFPSQPQDEIGLHAFGRATAEVADLAVRFNFNGGKAEPCVLGAPGDIALSNAIYTKAEDGGTLTVTATRASGSVGAVGVSYAITGGTATLGEDYTFTPGTLSWADGDAASKTFTINVIDDGGFESDETVNFAIMNPSGGATLGTPNTAVLTITDNDGVSVCNAWSSAALASGTTSLANTYTVGGCGNRLLVCAVTAELNSESTSFTVSGAYGGSNFTLLKSTSGLNTRQHVWLGYVNETGISERGNNSIALSVAGGSSPSGSNLYCATYKGVDQTTPIAGSRANANSGSATVSFGGNVAVTNGGYIFYAQAANGTSSTPPSGYVEHWDQSLNSYSQSGASKKVSATGTENKSWSLNNSERWGLAIGSLNPALGGGNAGSISLSSATYSASENGGAVTITVSRVGGITGAVEVSYATMNGTATTAGGDYTAAAGALSWADGDWTDKTFAITILDDMVYEGSETVNIALSNPSGGAILDTPNTAVLTISDNEAPPPATRYDLIFDAGAPNMGSDGAINIVAQTSYDYTSTANRNRAALKTGVTLSGTQGRFRYGAGFSGSNYEMTRAYTPAYSAANGRIDANVGVSVDYYIKTAGGSTGTINAQLYEYNPASGVVGSAKGSWTSNSFSTTATDIAQTLTGVFNNPTFTVAAGNRLQVRFRTTQSGGEAALLYGATKSGNNGNSFISVVESAAAPDTTPPVVSGVTVTPTSIAYTSAAPTITATLTDDESLVTDCQYTTDGTTWTSGSMSGAASPWTCTATPTSLAGSLTINVRATSTGGTAAGTAVSRTVDNTAPSHSGVLTATAASASQINLNWPTATDAQAGMHASTRYKLVRATGAVAPADCTGSSIYSGTNTSYSNTGLSASTQYTYRLCAYDALNNVTPGLTATAATTTTYNFQPNTGTSVASGVTTNAPSCGSHPSGATRTLMDKNAHSCQMQRVSQTNSGPQSILDVYFNTAYAANTTVTGTSLKIRLRDGDAGGWTAGIRLVSIAANGTVTNFAGSEVPQTVTSGSDSTYTLSLTGQSATVPSGSKLGVKIRSSAGSTNDMRVYYGSAADTAGSGASGVLIVTESLAGADVTPPAIGTVTVEPSSGAYTTAAPTITASLTDIESPVTGCEYTTDGSTWVPGSKGGAASPWTCTAQPTALSGSLTINMRATSTGGIGSGTAVSRTVDASGPTTGTLTVTAGNAQNSLAWTASSDTASGLRATNTYDVRYFAGGTAPTCSTGTSVYTGTALSTTHSGLMNGTQYSYRVCAYDALNNASTGATGSGTPGDSTPPTIGTVSVSPTSGSYTSATPTITASLTDPGSAVTACEYTTNGSTWANGTKGGAASPWTCTAQPSALSGSLTINVRATSTGGTGTGTAVNRTVDATAPTHAGALTATPASTSQINLSWPAATDGESGLHASSRYKLVRATGATPPADCTGTAVYSGTNTSYNNTGLAASTTYSYRVCAYDAVGNVSPGLTAIAKTHTAYNFQPNSGTTVGGSVTTNSTSCGTERTSATITLMDKNSHSCASQRVSRTSSGSGSILDVYYNTAYAVNTDVTGTSLKIRLEDNASGGWTAGVRLVHIAANGTITNFAGSEVTQAIASGGDATYTLSLSGQSATVPAGSKLGVRIRATSGSSNYMRVRYGSTADNSSSTSGVLIVNEADVGPDTTPPAIGAVTVSPIVGSYTTASPSISASLTDAESAVTGCEYTTNGSTWTNGTKGGAASPWTCSASPTSLTGSLTINMRATSTGGIGTGTAVNLTVDSTGPSDGVLTVTPGNAQNALAWSAATDAASGLKATNTYTVRYLAGASAPTCSSGTSLYTGTALSYNHTGLSNGSQYSYRVCARDALDNSSTGASGSGTPNDTTPPSIGTVTVAPTSGSFTTAAPVITASLTDAESTVTACQYSTDGSTWSDGLLSGAASPWTCTASPTALSGSLSINVRATSAGGTGTGAAVARTVDATAPAHSGALSATPASTSQINLSWPAATDAASGLHASSRYKLVRATSATPPTDCSGSSIYSGTNTTYNNSGLSSGTQYAYRLCAYDAVGNVTSGLTATAKTQTAYNFQPNSGTAVASGVTTNAPSCGSNMSVATRTLMDRNAQDCDSQRVSVTSSGARDILDVYFNTAFTASTVVTGSSLKIRLRDNAGSTWTAGIRLVHIAANGTISNFSGSEVTQVIPSNGDSTYTLSLSGQSATIPAGSKLGVRIRSTSGSSNDMRVYYGRIADTAGTGSSGILIVSESDPGLDTSPPTVGTVLVVPTNGSYTASTAAISADLTDAESPVTACQVTTDGSTWVTGTVSGSASPWTCSIVQAALSGSLTINVRGTSTGGTGTGTAVARTVDSTAPSHAGSLTATAASSSQINLSWPTATDAGAGMHASTAYKLVRATGATAPADCSGTAVYSGTATTYNNTGLAGGTQYAYRICAYDAVNNVTSGLTASATTQAASITFDTSSGTYVASFASTSWTHTVATDANYLLVGVSYDSRNSDTITATFNGTAMTSLGATTTANAAVALFGMANPPTGARTVAIAGGTATKAVVATASSWKGVSSVGTPVGAAALTVNVSSASGEVVVDQFASYKGVSAAVGAGQTTLYLSNTATGSSIVGGGSRENGAASVTMSWTDGGNQGSTAIRAVALKP